MRNSARYLWSFVVCGLLAVHCQAQVTNYPTAELRLNEEATGAGADIVTTRSAFGNKANAKWNTIVVRFPSPLKYRADLVLRGQVSVNSGPAPHHLGVKIVASGKTAYYQVRTPRKGLIVFDLPLSEATIPPDTKGKGALTAGDQIQSVSIFASYDAPVESAITLETFAVSLR